MYHSSVIPFIGDIFFPDRFIFEGKCINKSLAVSNLSFQNTIFEVELNLMPGIDKSQLDKKDAHVIIGIEVEIKAKDDVMQRASIKANVFNGKKTVSLPCCVEVFSGQLKIVKYHLVPIELLKIVDNDLTFLESLNFNPVENIAVFQKLNVSLVEVKKMATDVDVLSVIPLDSKNKIKNSIKILQRFKEDFALECLCSVQKINASCWVQCIHSLFVGIENCRGVAESCSNELQALRKTVKRKAAFIEMLREMGINYVSDPAAFNRFIEEEECFALFFNEELVKSNPAQFRKSIDFLREFIERAKNSGKNPEHIAVDLDVIPKNELRVPGPKKVVIYHLSKGKTVSLDMINDLEKRSSFNTAKYIRRGEENEPKRRGKFKLPCPNSLKGDCAKDYHEWLCEDCNTYFDYGFNNCLYCNCNDQKGTNLNDFTFRCSDLRHGLDYVRYFDRCSEFFDQIEPIENISIIILGQSGVGKSTLINGMINYILYNDINVAKEREIVTAIPTTDQYCRSQVIEVGKDKNKDPGNVFASDTLDCRTYNIKYTKNNKIFNIQLIDTPGLGDSRGIVQDKKNVKKIFDHLRNFDKLHGFCILLKSNESKIGVLMKFCIKEILTHLHKSCAGNIVYCFTNSRATFYRPGDTLSVLRKLLEEIHVRILLNKDTIYCFDNESYRYLCTLNRKGVKYTKDDEKSYEESWDRSVAETKRLLDYVIDLKPHRTSETLLLNQCRGMILYLTRPVADITHNIEMNIQIVQDHKKLIENIDERDRDLLKNLYVPQVTLENVPLGYPRTVCTSDSCVRYCGLSAACDLQQTEYVTHCHPHCYLPGVTPEQYPNPYLKCCVAISGGENCKKCGCSWKTHMHILYDQKRTEIRVKNQSVDTNVGKNKDVRKEKEQIIDDLERQVARLNEEKKKIIQIAGKFAYFLKKYAITPYNDCFCDYLDYLIALVKKMYKTEKQKALLDDLKKTKATYEEEINFIVTAIGHSPVSWDYDSTDLKNWKDELCKLLIHN